jgi:hypothetical protein
MKKLLFVLMILSIALGCQQEQKKKRPVEAKPKEVPTVSVVKDTVKSAPKKKKLQIPQDSIFIDPENFYYTNLRSFDLRNWYYGKFMEKLKSLTKEKIVTYFQDIRIDTSNVYVDNWKYFSVQKISKTESIITILKHDESCCAELHYLIYDENHNLISDNVVAGTGGDGGWAYDAYGKFVNDSTYVLTRVDSEDDDLLDEKSLMYIDSVITKYRFHKYESFEKLSEQKFEKKQKVTE